MLKGQDFSHGSRKTVMTTSGYTCPSWGRRSDEIVMKNLGGEHQTSLIVQSRNVNKGLDEDFFSLRKLKSPE